MKHVKITSAYYADMLGGCTEVEPPHTIFSADTALAKYADTESITIINAASPFHLIDIATAQMPKLTSLDYTWGFHSDMTTAEKLALSQLSQIKTLTLCGPGISDLDFIPSGVEDLSLTGFYHIDADVPGLSKLRTLSIEFDRELEFHMIGAYGGYDDSVHAYNYIDISALTPLSGLESLSLCGMHIEWAEETMCFTPIPTALRRKAVETIDCTWDGM